MPRRLYTHEHPLALGLDIDTVRGMLGGWLDHPAEAGLAARRLAIAMARVHLLSERDVLVPQFLGRLEFVLELADLPAHAGEVGDVTHFPGDHARLLGQHSVTIDC